MPSFICHISHVVLCTTIVFVVSLCGQMIPESPVYCSSGCLLKCYCKDNQTCHNMTGSCPNGCANGPGNDTGSMFPYAGPGCQTVNQAYGKVDTTGTIVESFKATDGIFNTCMTTPLSQVVYNISGEAIHFFSVIVFTTGGCTFDVRIASFVTGPDLSNPCMPIGPVISANSTRCDFDCSSIQPNNIGRRLRFRNISNIAINTSLCEIIAYGAPALPGVEGAKNCAAGEYNATTGCSNCSSGWTGRPYCNQPCVNGTYDSQCTQRCPVNCPNDNINTSQTCHSNNGSCYNKCTPGSGWTGPKCDQLIPLPEFAPSSLNVIGVNTSSVTLHWLRVINATNTTAQYYTYNVLMTSPTLPNQTSVTNLTDSGGLGQNLTVDNLNASTTYSFVIVPYRVIDGVWNEGLSSNTVYVTTNATIPEPVPMPVTTLIIIVVCSVGGTIVIVGIILVIVCVRRKRQDAEARKKPPTDLDKGSTNGKLESQPHKHRAPQPLPVQQPEDVALPIRYESDARNSPVPKFQPVVEDKPPLPSVAPPRKPAPRVEDVPDEQPSFIPTPPTKPNKPLPVAKKPAVIPAKPFDALATVSVAEFGDWLAQAKQTDALSNLFKQLPADAQMPMTVALLPQNKKKNGYDIRPYDHNRVVLDDSETAAQSDYINASLIAGQSANSKGYIACIGPRQDTCEDFWRMVWQCDVYTIVMLVNLQERGKVKCHQYWPGDEPKEFVKFGIMTVETHEVKHYADFTIRTLDVWHNSSGPRRVTQYHMHTFGDREDVPQSPVALVDLYQKVQTSETWNAGPIVVHCSAGIGRTGVFVALDLVMCQAKATSTVAIHECVLKLRSERVMMVQLVDQYKFLYDAVAFVLALSMKHASSSSVTREDFEKMTDASEYSNAGVETYAEHTAVAAEAASVYARPVFTELTPSSPDERKVRSRNIMPVECRRVLLQPALHGTEGFINAVYVDTFSSNSALILTETPQPETVQDFWQMVVEQRCTTIMSLDPSKTDNYWPRLGSSTRYGQLQIELTSEQHCNDGLTVRGILVTTEQDSFEVKHVQLQQIDRNDSTAYQTKMSAAAEFVQARHWTVNGPINTNTGRIVVHCRDGVTHSGLFCVVLWLIDQLAIETKIDLLFAVLHVRQSRPQIMKKDQYLQALHVLKGFMEKDYENT